MANTWISETENDIEELQITQEDITERTPLRNKLHNFKSFLEKPRKNRSCLDWEKERETQGRSERDMKGKEKGRNQAVETNIVHSGLFDK